jgi:hypothetical protein
MALAAGRPAGPRGKSDVSDIFSEVDEEVRREQLLNLWHRYGWLLIAVCALIVIGVGGWRGYQWYVAKEAAKAGAAFEAAAALATEGKSKEAEEAFAKLAIDGTASYRTLAKFREAEALAQRDGKGAVALYDQVSADGAVKQPLRDLASLRAGLILIDTASYDEIKRRLEPLTAADRTFRHSARATLAMAAWHAHDTTAMRHWTDMILADAETPPGTRGQIQMLMALSDTDKKS